MKYIYTKQICVGVIASLWDLCLGIGLCRFSVSLVYVYVCIALLVRMYECVCVRVCMGAFVCMSMCMYMGR